ncbi:MAG: hypothetical protein VCA55_03810 [Verrucomicrobiales bacterium]
MSCAAKYAPPATLKIRALPSAADAGISPAEIVIKTDPVIGRYPDIVPAEEPVEVSVHALGVSASARMNGIIRWRKTLASRWQETGLRTDGTLRWKGEWIPPTAGDYQWIVKLQPGKNQSAHIGQSGSSALHLLRAERRELFSAQWFRAPREPLSSLIAQAESNNAGIFLLPPLFPEFSNRMIGNNGAGHYTISPRLGNPSSFGELAAKIHRQGKILGLTMPMRCSPEHPFRAREPMAFSEDGTPDLTGKNWQRHQKEWEGVFRYWIVQGIEIFEIPDPGKLPLSFWQHTIKSLRDDFPDIVFTSRENSNPDLSPHLLGIGFSGFNAPGITTDVIPAPSASRPGREISCSSSNPNLIASIRKSADGEFLLRISNDNPTSAQAGHIHLFGATPELKECERYYLHNLTDGRSCHWMGTTNFVSLKAGEQARTLRIQRSQ